MKILPNGNIEITVQLLPESYAALAALKERDKGTTANVINLALMSHNIVSAAMKRAGQPLADVEESDSNANPVGDR